MTIHSPGSFEPLRLENVCRSFQSGAETVHALVEVNLTVEIGELVALTGRSGAGKSTLLRLAGALDRPQAGSVSVFGVDTAKCSPREAAMLRRRDVGYVFQELNLIPTLTAGENVSLPLELDGISTREAKAAAETALATVGLDGISGRFPDELSGGQQQRVAIARSFVGGRRLLLADEPTGALDSLTADDVMRIIRQRCTDGSSAVVVTHDPGVAVWADRVITIRDGRIQSETVAESFEADLAGSTR